MELSNDVEKYEIEVNKMGQNYSFFLTVYLMVSQPLDIYTLDLTIIIIASY